MKLASPQEMGFPEKFRDWRTEQERGIVNAIDSRRRFVLQNAPTGSGKSAMGIAQAILTGMRCLYLTSTRGLQTQAMKDFSALGLTDIRGMAAYPCILTDNPTPAGVTPPRPPFTAFPRNCADGACRSGFKCKWRDGGCTYYDAWREARRAQLVITNYQYRMTIEAYGEGLGEFDLLICDEAHNIINELSLFLQFSFEAHEVEGVMGARFPEGDSVEAWVQWGQYWCPAIAGCLMSLIEEADRHRQENRNLPYLHHREIRELKNIYTKLVRLSNLQGEWVVEKVGKKATFEPVWPSEQAESVLFRGIKHVVLYSATLCEKTADLLGIPPDDREYHEYPSTFPASRRPVIHVPTTKVGMVMGEAEKRLWASRIDQLISQRLDWKGIIHTRSYRYRDYLLSQSRYSCHMLTHDAGSVWDTERQVEAFKKAKPPCIMISPALGTGWDFPDDTARWQIVAKLPFADKSSKVLQARMTRDKEYYGYVASQDLQQISGRIVRSKEDWGETLITDDHVRWFTKANAPYLARWWMSAYRTVSVNPKPLNL